MCVCVYARFLLVWDTGGTRKLCRDAPNAVVSSFCLFTLCFCLCPHGFRYIVRWSGICAIERNGTYYNRTNTYRHKYVHMYIYICAQGHYICLYIGINRYIYSLSRKFAYKDYPSIECALLAAQAYGEALRSFLAEFDELKARSQIYVFSRGGRGVVRKQREEPEQKPGGSGRDTKAI